MKRPFTLMEILICLLILSIAAGTIGIRIVDALSSHRFHLGVGEFASQVKELQLLAMTHRADMELHLFKDKEEWKYQNKSEPSLKVGVLMNPLSLGGASTVKLNGKIVSSLPFQIYSTGRVEPAGVLEFQRDEEKIWIDMREPLHIKICNRYPPKEEYTTQLPEFPCKSPAQPSSTEQKSPPNTLAKEKTLTLP
ncbi:MAG TPA: prepilin-type N-terminal cleavage/methylation domain-containing protein [Rhabdochlamydiaceae bacterium]